MIMETKSFIVEKQSSLRIDKLLCLLMPDFTRTRISNLIEQGNVTVEDKVVNKSYCPKQFDRIEVRVPDARPLEVLAQDIPIEIVYEDEHVIVVNKPKGMVVHPAHGNPDNTLVNALLFKCDGKISGINGILRPGIVHRIDKDTSGLLVAAKTDLAHIKLAEQFKEHSIDRVYEGIVFGNVKDDKGVIDLPIGRSERDRKKMAVTNTNSKNAVTHFEVIERFNGFTHLRFKLETGRTHQIRVHMSYIGHFLLGDLVYGRPVKKLNLGFDGQCLHARTLGFNHPSTDKRVVFDCGLPDYFVSLIDKLKCL